MPPPSNQLCKCKKSGAWRTKYAAMKALERILDGAETARRFPTGVTRCTKGIWHLTSKNGKVWAHGKNRRSITYMRSYP